MLVDSHCHLNYLDDPDARLTEARQSDVSGFLCVGVDQATQTDVLAIANRHDDVWASVGVHPDAAVVQTDMDWIASSTATPKVVAVGETGLDFFHLGADDSAARHAQIQGFDAQLAIASETRLPVIVHTRGAEQETRQLLEHHADVCGVLHCFTESWELARSALDLGFYVSISGIVTFKNADNVRAVARRIPLDRLLVETDAPWLAPVPHRGAQNHPALVAHTARFLAELRDIDIATLAEATTDNFYTLFNRAIG